MCRLQYAAERDAIQHEQWNEIEQNDAPFQSFSTQDPIHIFEPDQRHRGTARITKKSASSSDSSHRTIGEFDVDKILMHSTRGEEKQYLVKWKDKR